MQIGAASSPTWKQGFNAVILLPSTKDSSFETRKRRRGDQHGIEVVIANQLQSIGIEFHSVQAGESEPQGAGRLRLPWTSR